MSPPIRRSTSITVPAVLLDWVDERCERHGTSRNAEMTSLIAAAMDRAAGQGADFKFDELLRTERLIGFEMAQDDLKRELNELRIPRGPLGSPLAKLSDAIRLWITSGRKRAESVL
jgi:hypothetical protein